MLTNDCGNVFTRLKTDSNETNAQKQTCCLIFSITVLLTFPLLCLSPFVLFCFPLVHIGSIVLCVKCYINKVELSFRSKGINAHIISSPDKNFMLASSHFGAI